MSAIFGWVRRHLWRIGVAAVVVLAGASMLLVLNGRSSARRERTAENRRTIAVLCGAINQLPSTLALALDLREQRARIVVQPTTTLPPADLTPEQRAEVARIDRELAGVVDRLGDPVDCFPKEDADG